MRPAITIYRQTYTHKGYAFQVWSYLDDPEPQKSTMRFAFRVEGETVQGLSDRAEAIRKARRHLDALPGQPDEKAAAGEAPMAGQQQQQQDVSRQPDRAAATQGELFL